MRDLSILIGLLVALAGCSNEEEAPPTPAPPQYRTTIVTPKGGEAGVKAREVFSQRCTPCHGAEGRGDGAASASLTPRPRNFHDAEWQQGVTDDYLIQIIKAGGAAVSKSPAMPGNPDLKDEAVLVALKDHIRELGKVP
jgi:hypothetical protein